MFKKLTTLALIAAASSAYAVDGTVTVSGTVVSNTCTVAPSTSAVTLPTVSTSALNAIGAVAGMTPWNVTVSGCGATSINMNTYFEYGTSTNAGGRLSKVSGTSTNVDVQVLQLNAGTLTVLDLSKPAGSQNTTAVATNAGGTATQFFFLRYYATAATVGAGSFNSSFTFTVVYS